MVFKKALVLLLAFVQDGGTDQDAQWETVLKTICQIEQTGMPNGDSSPTPQGDQQLEILACLAAITTELSSWMTSGDTSVVSLGRLL